MKRVTIKDVAQMAGVSPRTVSRVINNDANVSEKTRQKVLKIVKEVGFEANLLARGLKEKRTNTIIAFADDHRGGYWGAYHNDLFKELMKEVRRHNYQMVISSSSAETYEDDVNDGFYMLKRGLADGAIICDDKPGDKRIEYLKEREIPFVIVGKDSDNYDTCCVNSDNLYVGYMGAEYLASKDKKKIIFLLGSNEYNVNKDRAEGFLRFFKEKQNCGCQGHVIFGVCDIESAYSQTMNILAQSENNRPDAIFISGDERAMGVYRAIYEMGLSIPDDIAVLGIDNIQMGEFYHPPITTIDLSIPLIAKHAFEILHDQLEKNERTSRRMIIAPSIMERESV